MTTAPAPATSGVATARNIGATISRLWDVRTAASHLVPGTGPVILAANHTGLLDGPLLAAVSPRPVHLLARSALFVGVWDRLLRASGQVPVAEGEPARAGLLQALGLLADDRVVGVFPEGERGRGDVARIQHGVAYLAVRSGAPVVPVAVLGTRRSRASLDSLPRPRARVDVVFGSPLQLPADGDPRRRAALSGVGELIRQGLADHVRLACRRTGRQLPELPGRVEDQELT